MTHAGNALAAALAERSEPDRISNHVFRDESVKMDATHFTPLICCLCLKFVPYLGLI